jgi:hypothetical protein
VNPTSIMGGPRVKQTSVSRPKAVDSHSKSAQIQDGGNSDKENRSCAIPACSGTPGMLKKKLIKQQKAVNLKKMTPAKSVGNTFEIGDFDKEKATSAKRTVFIQDEETDDDESLSFEVDEEVKPTKRMATSRGGDESDGEEDDTGDSTEGDGDGSDMDDDDKEVYTI